MTNGKWKFSVLPRFLWRLFRMASMFALSGAEAILRRSSRWDARRRAQWQGKWAGYLLKWIGFKVKIHGTAPKGGFIVSNHLGYMDIVVLATITPQVFLSKSDVAKWPLVGWYTVVAGTLFIDRRKRSDVANKDAAFAKVINEGLGLTVFLEGTSTHGREILPYRSSLLQPAIDSGWDVTPVYLKYECEEGDVEQDICWWGDMGFMEHLLRMLKVKRSYATVVFGEARKPVPERKALSGHA